MPRRLLAWVLVASIAAGCTSTLQHLAGRTLPKDLVSDADYPDLLVEVDHPQGYGPDPAALDVLKATLREVATKRTIDVRTSATIPAEPNKKYTQGDLDALVSSHQDAKTGGDAAVLYVLYVAGGYEADSGDSRVLGLGSAGGPVVMFKGNLLAATQGGLLGLDRPRLEFVERAVLVHEFGHAVGLVNAGAPMVRDHEDKAHGAEGAKHSANPNSVMYYQIETTRGLQSILSRGADIPYQFDADDKADLRALREG